MRIESKEGMIYDADDPKGRTMAVFVRGNADLVALAMNHHRPMAKALANLVALLEEVEDIEHDFFECSHNEACPLCAAKLALRDVEGDELRYPVVREVNEKYEPTGTTYRFCSYKCRDRHEEKLPPPERRSEVVEDGWEFDCVECAECSQKIGWRY